MKKSVYIFVSVFTSFALRSAAFDDVRVSQTYQAGSSTGTKKISFVTDQERNALKEEISQAYQEVLAQSKKYKDNVDALIARKEENEKDKKYREACQGYLWASFCLPIDDEQQQELQLSAHKMYYRKLKRQFPEYKTFLMAGCALGNERALDFLFSFYRRNKQNKEAEVVCDISNSKHASFVLARHLSKLLANRSTKPDEALIAKFEHYATRAKSYRELGWTYNSLARRFSGLQSMRFNQLAIESYQKALEAGDRFAADPLAELLKNKRDDQKRIEVLKRGAELGDSDSALKLAKVVRASDVNVAIQYAHQALELSDFAAYNTKFLAGLYIDNNDFDNAEKYLIQAAKRNCDYGLDLGDFYRDIRQNYLKAAACYQEALKNRIASYHRISAYERLGKLYEHVLKDIARAEKMYAEKALLSNKGIRKLFGFWDRHTVSLGALEQKIIAAVAAEKMDFARVLLLSRMRPNCFSLEYNGAKQEVDDILISALESEESPEVIIYLIKRYNLTYAELPECLDDYEVSHEFQQELLACAKKYYEENDTMHA